MKEIMQRYAAQSQEDRAFLQILLQCAPILTNDKPASIINVSKAQYCIVTCLAKVSGIRYKKVAQIGEREILFLYNRTLLASYLQSRKVKSFLEWYGYEEGALETSVETLMERYRAYQNKEGMFPHEMGVFLGYPLKDVKGFILNAGKGYRTSGYWKVYASVPKAKRIFAAYDRARTRILTCVLEEQSYKMEDKDESSKAQ